MRDEGIGGLDDAGIGDGLDPDVAARYMMVARIAI